MKVMIQKKFGLIFTTGLLLTLGVLWNLKDGNVQEPRQDAGDTLETATLLPLGTPYREDIDPGDDVDYFRIVLTEAGKLTVRTIGKLDTEGELQNSSGTNIAENSDSGVGYNFRIIRYMEPGTYYLKVEEYDEEKGSYILHAKLEPGQKIVDAGSTRETARSLALGTPFSEDMEPSGDVDYFRIVVAESGKLIVWTTGELDTEGELQNSSGTNIAENSDDGTDLNFIIVYTVEPGTYYLKVTEYSNDTGSYVVHAKLEPGQKIVEAGGTRETAALLTLGETPYPEYIGEPNSPIYFGDDVDYFRIVVTQSGKLTVWTSSLLDMKGELQAQDGTVLDSDDDGLDSPTLDFRIVYIVEPGTYYLKVTELDQVDGSYYIYATLAPGQKVVDVGNTRETATLLTLGTPYPEDIDSVANQNYKDVDYFRIVVAESGKLIVWTIGELDTEGELQTDDGTVLVSNDDWSDGLNFRIVYIVEPGTYYLKVGEYAYVTGSYIVQATLETGQIVADVGDTRETATLLLFDTNYTEDLDPFGDVDYFRIVVTESGRLTAWTFGELDTVGELQNSSGDSIADNRDDGPGPGSNFRIVYNVEPGTYYLKVEEYWEETGTYGLYATLETGQIVADIGDTRETAALLTLGTPYPEDIDPNDDVDYFRIVVAESGKLIVWTTGELDTEGELQNSSGASIADNRDDGPGNNFRILYNMEPGTYYLKVMDTQGEAGNYTVHATLEPGEFDTGETNEGEPTQPDLSTHRVVFSEFMFESEGGENSLPQWIEVYNNSSSETNLRGWKLQWKRLQPSLLEVATVFKEDFIIPAQQSRLIVTALGRHSGGGGGHLSDEAVYQLHVLHAEELVQEDIANRNRLITRGGFSLKLINPNDVLIDQIGTLNEDKQTWQLHESLIDGVRSSLIRRFDKNVPRSGLERRGWRRAYDTKRLVAGLYYGHRHDLSTPGYRRGKPLPVELSQFSARFDKDRVVITWTTESELNNAGFNILRSTSPTKNFRPINPTLIQGAGTTGQRNEYQFIDKTAKPDVAYYYRLEEVDLSGTRAFFNTYRLRGVITPTHKRITNWGTLKDDR